MKGGFNGYGLIGVAYCLTVQWLLLAKPYVYIYIYIYMESHFESWVDPNQVPRSRFESQVDSNQVPQSRLESQVDSNQVPQSRFESQVDSNQIPQNHFRVTSRFESNSAKLLSSRTWVESKFSQTKLNRLKKKLSRTHVCIPPGHPIPIKTGRPESSKETVPPPRGSNPALPRAFHAF